ncbi:phosphohistidine phosphatase, SixA [[Leptolyngbya] sp. PCC 7376]|uniref:phosphohistidine phosphatase SixA n=1 Tax=[Leptolyngbya] sp. PCC 7376 TaxID=111781 RepID=UPI00029EE4A1|nr:phosphohistidine phosphatase SixA [[Leptolyngbya] sp. PCC 7376]AFY36539.1 phosphohistidine phosphatase, SixA [[Leptolyngbya] sp. PCC 7376]
MDLYLFRHGIAAERSELIHDAERPLVAKGQRRTRQVAKRLRQIGVQFDEIVTSPLLRAQQTADILHEEKLGDRPISFPPLAPTGSFVEGLEWLKEWQNRHQEFANLVCVGHQPNLGNWAEQLLWGQMGDRLVVKKAGIIGIHLDRLTKPASCHELFLLTSPKWLI